MSHIPWSDEDRKLGRWITPSFMELQHNIRSKVTRKA
jgi:hypothetical protein